MMPRTLGSCTTAGKKGGGTDPSTHQKPCPCVFETLPDGEATAESTRSVVYVELITTTLTKRWKDVAGDTFESTFEDVPINFKVHLSSWSDPSMSGWTSSQNICKCTPISGTTVNDPDEPVTVTPEALKEAEKEKERGRSTPKGDAGG